MKKIFLLIVISLLIVGSSNAQIEEWIYTYNNDLANETDVANDIAIDNDGNVIICGESRGVDGAGLSPNFDFITIKLDSSGNELWTERYSQQGETPDRAKALAIDMAGNVFVVGTSWIDSTRGDDLLLLKYAPDGTLLWDRLFDSYYNNDEDAYGIVVDSNGDCYITGYSSSIDTISFSSEIDSIFTIKYDASGNQQWTRSYLGPGKILVPDLQMVIDDNNNIYISGATEDTITGFNYDIILLKYTTSGTLLWDARYDYTGVDGTDVAKDMTVDGLGNIYITGSSVGSGSFWDYVTLKYNSSGTQLWSERFEGNLNDYDYAYALDIDPDGNAYVTGISAHDQEHNILTLKYDSTGVEQWVKSFNGNSSGSSNDCGKDVVVNSNGEIYVVGYSELTTDYEDILMLKYSSSGSLIWQANYDGTDANVDTGQLICKDNNDNIYASGSLRNTNASLDIAVIKFGKNNTGSLELGKHEVYSIYPNPNNSRGTLIIKGVNEGTTVAIYGITGKLILSQKIGEIGANVSLPELASGTYFVQIITNKISSTQALVIK